MPDMSRESGIRHQACGPWLRSFPVWSGLTAALLSSPAFAQGGYTAYGLQAHELAAFGLHVGIVCSAVICGIALLRTRRKALLDRRAASDSIASLQLALDRTQALTTFEPQAIVVFDGDKEPEIQARPDVLSQLSPHQMLLAFGTWLGPEDAQAVETAITQLRQTGQTFSQTLLTLTRKAVEIEGRPIGGQAVVRMRLVTGIAERYIRLNDDHAALRRNTEQFAALIGQIKAPVWLRDEDGKITWANAAFAEAMGQENPQAALDQQHDFLDAADRTQSNEVRAGGQAFTGVVSASAAGQRRQFDLLDTPLPGGSGAIAIDVSQLEQLRASLKHESEGHKRTLDQLDTAIAIFDSRRRLTYHNAAYRHLWDLPAAFLDSQPLDEEIFDQLRTLGRLPMDSDIRQLKTTLMAAYSSPRLEPQRHEWHLLDGRALSVVQNPDEQGGLTYVFEDLTESLRLQGQMNRLSQVQRETLDNLEEAVAVFGSDGRLNLHNAAFTGLWGFAAESLTERPHVEQVFGPCREQAPDDGLWARLTNAVVSLTSTREPFHVQLERKDGQILDIASVPLPDGGTLIAFRNITDSVEKQRTLETTARIKGDFVENVSYQLRTPLTTIIGFAQVLDDASVGPLNPKQKEYLGFITASSGSLLALINDILDLATIDAGAMELDLGQVDVKATLIAVASALRDRLAERKIHLLIEGPEDPGIFEADGQRIRQILFNLLANAIAFSPEGGRVRLITQRRDGEIAFRVEDNGAGIPAELKEQVFERFEARRGPSRHRGAGLGLSIVREFVTLHHGRVLLETKEGAGTRVTVILPVSAQAQRSAAE